MTFCLRAFGTVALEGPLGPVSGGAAQQRSLAVLALLASAHPHGCTRDKLAGYLWPDSDQERARHRLADVLHVIRKSLGEDAIVTVGELVQLKRAVVDCDVALFLSACAAGDLESAVGAYSGPFLDGFALSGAPEFERWVEAQRQRLGDAYAEALHSLMAQAQASGDQVAAARWWKRLLNYDPYNSRYALGLIEALALSGDPANAWLVLDEHERRLREELEVDPPGDLRQRAEQLIVDDTRAGRIAGRTAPVEFPIDHARPAREFDTSSAGPTGLPREHPARRDSRRSQVVAGVIAAVLVLLAGWFGRSLFDRQTPDPPSPSIRPYTIVTVVEGSAAADVRSAVHGLIASELDRTGMLQVLPDAQIALGLARAGMADTTSLSAATAQELAVRGHIPSIVVPSLEQLGTSYSLSLRVLRATGDSTIATAAANAIGEDGLIGAVERAVHELRERLGEGREAIAQTRGIGFVATSSFEAFQRFDQANERFASGDRFGAIQLYEEALALDPAFALAWSALGSTAGGVGDAETRDRAYDSALVYADRLSQAERLNLEGKRARASGDLEGAVAAWTRLAESGAGPNNLGTVLDDLGRTSESVALLLEKEKSPFGLSVVEHANLAYWLPTLGRYDEAWQRVDSLGNTVRALNFGMRVAAASAAWARAESLAALGVQRPERNVQRHAFSLNALVSAARGRVRASLTWLERLPPSLERLQPTLILHQASGTPVLEDVPLEVRTDTSSTAITAQALWAVASGDTATARRQLALVRARPRDARRDLEVALDLVDVWVTAHQRPNDAASLFGSVAARTTYFGLAVNQLSRWLAADAYARAGQRDSAVVWFERIAEWQDFWSHELPLRGLTESFARQRLVLLYSEMGRLEDARRHYRILTETFTDPDPELADLLDDARKALREAERRFSSSSTRARPRTDSRASRRRLQPAGYRAAR